MDRSLPCDAIVVPSPICKTQIAPQAEPHLELSGTLCESLIARSWVINQDWLRSESLSAPNGRPAKLRGKGVGNSSGAAESY